MSGNPSSSRMVTVKILPNGTADDDDDLYHDDDESDDNSEAAARLVHGKLPASNNMIRGQNDLYAIGKKISPGRYGAVYEVCSAKK